MMGLGVMIHVGALVPLPSTQKGTIVEHILGHGVQGPEVTLSRISRLTRNFDEAVVQTQIVANRVLPGGKLLLVVPEPGEGKRRWIWDVPFNSCIFSVAVFFFTVSFAFY